MTEYSLGLFNVLLSIFTCQIIKLLPIGKNLGWKRCNWMIYLSAMALYIFTGFHIMERIWGIDDQTLQTLKIIIALPINIFDIWLFRKQLWRIVFLVSLSFMYGTVYTGIGIYAAETWLSSFANAYLTESAVSLAVTAVTLPPLMPIIKRLYDNPHMKQAVVFWRFIWLLPIVFFTVTIMTSNHLLNDDEKGISFVVIRAVLYGALLLMCYLFEKAIRQISEAEDAKRKAEESEAKTDFYRRMSHEIRTPLTKVSTNIQIANMQEETDHERLTKSQKEIMRIAGMINAALDDNESGADE